MIDDGTCRRVKLVKRVDKVGQQNQAQGFTMASDNRY